METPLQTLLDNVAKLPPNQQREALDYIRHTYGDKLTQLLDLPPVWRTDLVDGFGNAIEKPPHFDEFISSDAFMGQPGLMPRQETFLRRGMSFDPDYLFSRRKTIYNLIAMWGKGCLAADEKLTDHRSGLTKTVAEWADDGRGLLLSSWDGKRVLLSDTSPVERKGKAQLYRVTLEDGRSFRATAFHRCLTPDGWRTVDELAPGCSLLTQPELTNAQIDAQPLAMTDTAVSCPRVVMGGLTVLADKSGRLKSGPACETDSAPKPDAAFSRKCCLVTPCDNALRDWKTLEDFQGDCRALSHSDGVRPRLFLGDDPTSVPLPDDARARSRKSLLRRAFDAGLKHSRFYQWIFRPMGDTSLQDNRAVASSRHVRSIGAESFLHQHCAPEPVQKPSCRPDNPLQSSQHSTLCGKTYCAPLEKQTYSFPQFSVIRSIEAELVEDFYDLTVPETHCYFDAQGILHHNSGKDYICSLLLAYVCYVINAMADPWDYLKHAPGEPIDIANIALNADQANKVFFNKLKARLRKPCFKGFAPKINRQDISFFRQMPGDLEPTLLLQCHSLHAQNDSWEGKSLICWVMDEADAFEDESGNSNADQCYLTLASSAASRFGSRYLGLIISFRRVGDGFMDRMRTRCDEAPSEMVYDIGATWEIRPDKSRQDPEIVAHYKADPIDAACKYENIAPPTIGGFFTLPTRLDACCTSPAPKAKAIEWESIIANQQTGSKQRYIALRLEDWNIEPSDTDKMYFLHGDPGHTNASFAVSVCHAEINRAVARGHDKSDAESDYMGDILHDDGGRPIHGARVVYFADPDPSAQLIVGGEQAPRTNSIGTTYTDREGKHALWLAPGRYAYCFYDRNDHLIRHERGLEISAGIEMLIESPDAYDEETGIRAEKRIVYPVVEDFILEWIPRDGMPVDYGNVESTILEICQRLPVYQVSFDKFNSVQLVQNLAQQGINAIDVSFSNPVQMAMFRNLRQMVNAGLMAFLKGEPETTAGRALRQLKRLRNRGNVKVEPPSGEWKDLADARAASVYYCCVHSEGMTTNADPNATMVWSMGGQQNLAEQMIMGVNTGRF